ncbi:NUMOD3 domain-containing DNA-binding protein [Halanaerobacter jeridensis]|uniref:Endogenous inhibitor of DNA gyrase (YacG/DUF329 family) n=1 Tax=Halanaerobacter jeridensis TaxID=706427 RepID=A0A938XQY3_9FIRM|nr:NUMOD3 domain-containing DNA-binding protein [Halanaerobacter jeridensis]MBM7555961.1 endogenous inhibitor of DNA gyrase (YacG/DUF329 family) [Halanaerobacter jeridensis]
MDFNSYAGFYRNNYLRSSYEFVYAKCLERLNIDYEVEETTYFLENGTSYKPDFFLYDNDELVKIVEIKSEYKSRIKKAKTQIALLQNQVDITIELIRKKQLKNLCKKIGLNFYELTQSWIDNKNTSKNHVLEGELNPLFGKKHTQKTKKLIGQKSKERFKDKKFREKHSNAVKKAMKKVDTSKLGNKKSRISKRCKICGDEFLVIETSNRKFCSKTCAAANALKFSNRKQKIERKKRNKEIRKQVKKVINSNSEFILSIPYNDISSSFEKLFKEILIKYNLKDLRNIAFAFYGDYSYSMKSMLKDFKRIAQTD